jgi:hypothetical protein
MGGGEVSMREYLPPHQLFVYRLYALHCGFYTLRSEWRRLSNWKARAARMTATEGFPFLSFKEKTK